MNIVLRKIRKYLPGLYPKEEPSVKLVTPLYTHIHPHGKFLIVGSGPSIETYKDKIQSFIDRETPLVMGTNHVSRLYKLDYHGFTNRRRFIEHVNSIQECSKVLISCYIAKWIIKDILKKEYWPIMYKRDSDADFAISDGVIESSCGTSALLLAAIALVMGAGEVFMIGFDGYKEFVENKGKINCLDVKPKFDSFEQNKEHYLRLQRLNEKYLPQVSDYLFNRSGNRVRIITPTVFEEYYDKEVLGIQD